MSKPVVVLSSSEWTPSAIKYMPPKVNERGGKSINMISKQTNRSLHISTPMLMTWGIADFIGDNGESDGKYSISLNFPGAEYAKEATDTFLQKMKDFENQILDDAVKNSELWWGEEMSREVAKHTFFPFLKYSKNKDTKKIDPSKPPSIRAKVPNYDGKWAVEVYDTKENLLFPCDNHNLTPVDFVPKLSQVACVIQCGGIWIGGKGWGLTWKLIQCVVKPREVVSVYGKCHIQLSSEDREAIDSQKITDADGDYEEDVMDTLTPAPTPVSVPVATVFDTSVADSDAEEEEEVEEEEPAPVPTPVPTVKKVVKKAAAPAPAPVPVVEAPVVEEATAVAAEPVKKKLVKKKAT